MLHVESHRFLLLVSYWVIVTITTLATVGAIAAGRCWCWCCRRELVLLQEGVGVMPTNRAAKQVSNLSPFSLSCSLFLSWSCRVKEKTKITTAATCHHCIALSLPWALAPFAIVAKCVVVCRCHELQRHNVAMLQCRELQRCNTTTLHSYDILGARMLWKPKEARILKNLKKNYRSTSVIW